MASRLGRMGPAFGDGRPGYGGRQGPAVPLPPTLAPTLAPTLRAAEHCLAEVTGQWRTLAVKRRERVAMGGRDRRSAYEPLGG